MCLLTSKYKLLFENFEKGQSLKNEQVQDFEKERSVRNKLGQDIASDGFGLKRKSIDKASPGAEWRSGSVLGP